MRAVLRIPRLSKKFHDRIRGGYIDSDIRTIDVVYKSHYGADAELEQENAYINELYEIADQKLD